VAHAQSPERIRAYIAKILNETPVTSLLVFYMQNDISEKRKLEIRESYDRKKKRKAHPDRP
jgi:hypothetical protein